MQNLNRRNIVTLDHAQKVPLAPKVVTLPIQVLPRGLAFLFPELSLLLLYPAKLRNRKCSDRI
jgi:hypothetical protein